MFTIVMDKNKCLSKKNVTTLYQGEKLVDKIRFLIPMKYGDLDLSKFTVKLKYIDPANIVHCEKLKLSEETYNNCMLCYYMPVDTKLTKFAGDILMRLTLDDSGQHTMYSSETTITISPQKHCFGYVVDDSSGNNNGSSGDNDSSSDEEGFKVVVF